MGSTLSWKTHIDQLASKLSSGCCTVRSLKSFMSWKNPRMVYFSYVHSLITYGVIFGVTCPTVILPLKFKREQ
jgi:hypothetical protein